ncbi:MAG: TetR/AcrR family transcriptional regulator [Trebonia sp.]
MIPADRPLRADARRNRDTVIAAARAAFAAADDSVPLEGIARDAGVGIGTLYRHFPTREALVEAVYGAELDDVTGSAPALLAKLPPDAALRAWMDRYAEFSSRKRGMIGTLRAGWSAGRITPRTRERINAAIGTILDAGTQSGTFRGDVEADDITSMLLGVFLSTAQSGPTDQTWRLLSLLVDAVRPGTHRDIAPTSPAARRRPPDISPARR